MANADWMADLDEQVNLTQVVMPGSHDACMYETRPGVGDTYVHNVVTQFHTRGTFGPVTSRARARRAASSESTGPCSRTS